MKSVSVEQAGSSKASLLLVLRRMKSGGLAGQTLMDVVFRFQTMTKNIFK